VNGIFGDGIGGGDVYFKFMAEAALAAGYPIHFFGGMRRNGIWKSRNCRQNLHADDAAMGDLGDVGSLGGQFDCCSNFRSDEGNGSAIGPGQNLTISPTQCQTTGLTPFH